VEEPEAKPAIPLYIHLYCAERSEVVAGDLGFMLDGEARLLTVGEEVNIPPRTPHTFWNAGEGELRFISEVRQPGQLQTNWETVFGLAEDGKVDGNGSPNVLQMAVLAPRAVSYASHVPLLVTKLLLALLGGIGRLLGYKARYRRHSG